jgi:hypothetical protein
VNRYVADVELELEKEDEAIIVRRAYKCNISALFNLSISSLLEEAEP